MTRVDEEPRTGTPITAAREIPGRQPRTMWLVVRRELTARGLSGAYIGSTVVTLLFVLAAIILPTLLSGGPTTHQVGVVGDGNEAIIRTASALANSEDDDRVDFETHAYDDVGAAEAAIEAEEIEVALVDGREMVAATAGGFGGSDLQQLLQRAAATQRVEAMVGEQQADQVIETLTSDTLELRVLSGQRSEENEGRAMIAYGGLVLTYMVILGYTVWVLTGVTEEKANRVIELLLAAARPWQLLTGKIIGISLLGLAQFAVTAVAAMVAIRVTGAIELPAVPTDMVATMILWVILGFGTYMVLGGAAGALATKNEDAQSAMTPISMLAVGGFFLSFVVLRDPDGVTAVSATFVPLTAPFVIPIRTAFHVLPVWQHIVAIAISVATTVALLRIGGRVYAGGLLQFGGRLKWREAFRRAEL